MNKILLGSLLGFGLVMGGTAVANADTITVQSGDTVSQIAQQNGTTVQAIEALNHFADVNKIYVGDTIEVGTKTNTSQTASTQTTQPQAQAPKVSTQTHQVSSNVSTSEQQASTSSSVKSQFIAAGGTEQLWNSIVIPESGGNPNAVNGQYHGLGQTNQSWGYGSVAQQTQGMVNYANSRYGSINQAVQFRIQNGFW